MARRDAVAKDQQSVGRVTTTTTIAAPPPPPTTVQTTSRLDDCDSGVPHVY